MFFDMMKNLMCSSCENGKLYYDQRVTFESWQYPEVFRLDDVDRLRDGIISEILVLVCNQCGAEERYTFKEIEKKFRKQLTNRILTLIAKGDIPDPGARNVDRTFIYCNKCSGYDGKGACPRFIYDNCEVKRLPYGF